MKYNELQKKYNNEYRSFHINNIYNYHDLNTKSNVILNQVPVNSKNGKIELYITKNLGREFPIDALVTIFVNNGEGEVEVKKFIATDNPTVIELPMAHSLGTPIEGPEYYFTTYNLTIESLGYYKAITNNIRLFPEITTEFYYNLNKIIAGEPDKDEIINIPTHPKDILMKRQ